MASIGAFNGSGSILSNVTPIQFRAVNFKQENEVAVTKTASGRIIRSTAATTLWRGTLELVSLTVSDFKQIQGFIAKAKGQLNDFTIEIPEISFRSATASIGTVSVSGSFGQGSTSVNLTKSVAGNATVFNMGDAIKFSGHNKVYVVTEDCVQSSTPSAFAVAFEPPLVLDVASAETVTYDNVPFKVILTSDLQEYQYNVDGTVNYRIDVQEVI